SSIIRTAIASYTYELRQETHILKHTYIPVYDPQSEIHRKISEISRKAHQIAARIYERGDTTPNDLSRELENIENELDKAVAEMYGISLEELYEIKRLYNILAGEEIVEMLEERSEAPKEPLANFTKTILTPLAEDTIFLTVLNPLSETLQLIIILPDQQTIRKQIEPGEHFIEIPVKPLPEGSYTLEYQL
ncbi:MAG: class I SAM-dependent DNA methyltransferase, partial [Deltaproteobacteria bacterium]|nr:class I SAM-dependent DNA methyltransferase [Deltaproteobacteria bacterium]